MIGASGRGSSGIVGSVVGAVVGAVIVGMFLFAPGASAEQSGEAGFLAEEGTPPPGANDPACEPEAGKETPVVLVHGTFETMDQNWAVVSPALRAEGYCVYALNYGDRGTGLIQDSAAELDEFVEDVRGLTGAEKVDVVGHSQGGMMPRYWIKNLGGAREVGDLVGLAPSNHGTEGNASRLDAEPADWGVAETGSEEYGPCVSCEQQQRGSEFLRELNSGNETPGPISYTVIATRYDEVIVPFELSFLDGSPERLTSNITLQEHNPLNPALHNTIYNDPDTFGLVLDALESPGPADPDRAGL